MELPSKPVTRGDLPKEESFYEEYGMGQPLSADLLQELAAEDRCRE